MIAGRGMVDGCVDECRLLWLNDGAISPSDDNGCSFIDNVYS